MKKIDKIKLQILYIIFRWPKSPGYKIIKASDDLFIKKIWLGTLYYALNKLCDDGYIVKFYDAENDRSAYLITEYGIEYIGDNKAKIISLIKPFNLRGQQ